MSNNTRSSSSDDEFHFMLSKISHEIRNPAALIQSFLQLFLSEHPELAEDYYLQKVFENMDSLHELLDELSNYNHSKKVSLTYLNPYLLLQEIIADAAPSLELHQISIELSKDGPIPRIPLDPVQFRQVCFNLIRNAGEAMPSGGTIKISVFFDGDGLYMHVQDQGEGIPEEYLATLFDPFVTHKKNGTGLGLAICKEIMTAHGGTISAASEPGSGAVFTLFFPFH